MPIRGVVAGVMVVQVCALVRFSVTAAWGFCAGLGRLAPRSGVVVVFVAMSVLGCGGRAVGVAGL